MEEQAARSAGNDVAGSFGSEEYAEYLKLKAELRQRRVEDGVKAVGNNRVIWRQRLVMRRADIKLYAPDEDLVAYSAIHKVKNPSGDSKQKVTVSDNEIAAYKALDPDFNKSITLAEIIDKVAELKVAGRLTGAGDNAGDGDEVADTGS